jgi:hypothetical protein
MLVVTALTHRLMLRLEHARCCPIHHYSCKRLTTVSRCNRDSPLSNDDTLLLRVGQPPIPTIPSCMTRQCDPRRRCRTRCVQVLTNQRCGDASQEPNGCRLRSKLFYYNNKLNRSPSFQSNRLYSSFSYSSSTSLFSSSLSKEAARYNIYHTNDQNKYDPPDNVHPLVDIVRRTIRQEILPLVIPTPLTATNNSSNDSSSSNNKRSRRIENLQLQVSDIRTDLEERVQLHLNNNVRDNIFLLSSSSLDVVMKEALYTWVKGHVSGGQLSYDQIRRVYDQLANFPQRRTWQLNIGNFYTVVRYGDTLRMIRDKEDQPPTTTASTTVGTVSRATPRICQAVVKGQLDVNPFNEQQQLFHIRGCPEMLQGEYNFVQTTIDEFQKSIRFNLDPSVVQQLLISPPWKKSVNPIRLNDFLRGQSVPLQDRPNVSMLLLTTCEISSATVPDNDNIQPMSPLSRFTSATVVAVYIPTKTRWIIDRQYIIHEAVSDHEGSDEMANNLSTWLLSISVITP